MDTKKEKSTSHGRSAFMIKGHEKHELFVNHILQVANFLFFDSAAENEESCQHTFQLK